MSNPSTTSNNLRLFYSSGRVAPDRKQVGEDFGLYHLGNPKVCIFSGQLQTTLEHHHPAPAQLIGRGRRLVVSGHSQYLLTGLGKSLPLTFQQQPGVYYKKRVYSVHTKGIPWVPSLGDRGGCANGPYRTTTTLGHATKTGSHSNYT